MSDAGTQGLGLAWPDEFSELLPLLRQQWGADELYLLHKLSGKSGALVYVADVQTNDFGGQAVLKLERSRNAAWKERTEAERHQQAFDLAPAYAAEHLPRIIHTLNAADTLAILSTIAGRGLEYARPWADCAHRVQLSVVGELSGQLLEDWNAGAALEKGLLLPQDLLTRWLAYRLDPDRGHIHGFLVERCGIPPTTETISFEGVWYPNPLAFALARSENSGPRLRALTGNVHGDLHGYNVLVGTAGPERSDHYYMIDLAMFQDGQFLLYDHAYFEISHLLMMRERADAANWRALLAHLGLFAPGGGTSTLRGDDVGLIELIGDLRRGVTDWIDRHQENRLSYMESQYLLARVAAGLNFTNKPLPDKARRMAFLYAAANLKDFLRLNALDWPKHGPPFDLDGAMAPAAEVTGVSPSQETVPDHPPLPDRPAVAVLPFENLSGDPSQDWLADGISQEIITNLSRADWLLVIGRGSTFGYKGQPIDVKRVGRELGVHYVVEGSLRRAGDRVRVSVQLVSALDSHHLWAERFDRDIDDVFDLQEEIAETIAANIDVRLRLAERKRGQHLVGQVGTWLEYQHALWRFFSGGADGPEAARTLAMEIARRVPDFVDAHALISIVDTRRLMFMASENPEADLLEADEHATRATELDEASSLARAALSRVLMLRGKFESAIEQAQLSVAANPNSSVAHLSLAGVLYFSGRAAEALPLIETTIRLSPTGPFRDVKMASKAFCHYVLGELEPAAEEARGVVHARQTGPFGPMTLAAVLARQEKTAEAAAAIADLAEQWPMVTMTRFKACWGSLATDYMAMFTGDLRSAGLPE